MCIWSFHVLNAVAGEIAVQDLRAGPFFGAVRATAEDVVAQDADIHGAPTACEPVPGASHRLGVDPLPVNSTAALVPSL